MSKKTLIISDREICHIYQKKSPPTKLIYKRIIKLDNALIDKLKKCYQLLLGL